jgi:hypothetical protein
MCSPAIEPRRPMRKKFRRPGKIRGGEIVRSDWGFTCIYDIRNKLRASAFIRSLRRAQPQLRPVRFSHKRANRSRPRRLASASMMSPGSGIPRRVFRCRPSGQSPAVAWLAMSRPLCRHAQLPAQGEARCRQRWQMAIFVEKRTDMVSKPSPPPCRRSRVRSHTRRCRRW